MLNIFYSQKDLVKNLAVAYLKLPSITESLQLRQQVMSTGTNSENTKPPLADKEELMIAALSRFIIEQPSDEYAIRFKPLLQTLYKIEV